MLTRTPKHRANMKPERQTFIMTEELTAGVLVGERSLLGLERRVLLPFRVCILPSGVIVSLLVVCC